ncbi:MAG: FMN-dependent NADH-azoreductase [Pseudonocardiales bacterium]|nr:FMN-dependent NADH-azoreductase [Pseudonocardiales bacterium]
MTTLLHVSASPRGAHSESLAIADSFLREFRRAHPDVDIDIFDLWDGTLPRSGRPPPPRR